MDTLPPPMVPIRYARLTLEDGRRLTLVLTRDDGSWVAGYEVTRDGDRTITMQGDTEVVQLQMVHVSAITKRTNLRMNLTYARLETAK